jgi:hypothetical protein
MQRIQLTEEQSRILAEARGENVEVYDPTGQLVSFMKWFDPMDAEEVARYLRRRGLPKGPTIPSARVEAMLRKFEEIDRAEGMTREKMEEIVRRVKAGEPI